MLGQECRAAAEKILWSVEVSVSQIRLKRRLRNLFAGVRVPLLLQSVGLRVI